MEITEVRIKLMEKPEDRLRGFCSVTFDHCFVIRDLKIIEGNRGPFVAMPSRKLTSNCHKCRSKNHLKANYCNQCGGKLRGDNIEHDANGRAKLYADIAHPINAECREAIQSRIVAELEKEIQLSREPGYRSRYDEGYDDRPRSRKQEHKPSHSQPASDVNQSQKKKHKKTFDEKIEHDESLADSKIDSQSEVETRIDIPRPSDHMLSSHQSSTDRISDPKTKNLPNSILRTDTSDGDDGFGKGIF